MAAQAKVNYVMQGYNGRMAHLVSVIGKTVYLVGQAGTTDTTPNAETMLEQVDELLVAVGSVRADLFSSLGRPITPLSAVWSKLDNCPDDTRVRFKWTDPKVRLDQSVFIGKMNDGFFTFEGDVTPVMNVGNPDRWAPLE